MEGCELAKKNAFDFLSWIERYLTRLTKFWRNRGALSSENITLVEVEFGWWNLKIARRRTRSASGRSNVDSCVSLILILIFLSYSLCRDRCRVLKVFLCEACVWSPRVPVCIFKYYESCFFILDHETSRNAAHLLWPLSLLHCFRSDCDLTYFSSYKIYAVPFFVTENEHLRWKVH